MKNKWALGAKELKHKIKLRSQGIAHAHWNSTASCEKQKMTVSKISLCESWFYHSGLGNRLKDSQTQRLHLFNGTKDNTYLAGLWRSLNEIIDVTFFLWAKHSQRLIMFAATLVQARMTILERSSSSASCRFRQWWEAQADIPGGSHVCAQSKVKEREIRKYETTTSYNMCSKRGENGWVHDGFHERLPICPHKQ